MLGPRAEIATRFTSQRPGMSPPLICELGINTFDRARCNSKQRLQTLPSLPSAHSQQTSVLLKEESGLSDRTARTPGSTVRVRPHNTSIS